LFHTWKQKNETCWNCSKKGRRGRTVEGQMNQASEVRSCRFEHLLFFPNNGPLGTRYLQIPRIYCTRVRYSGTHL
jgi:hypothetical protein